MSEVRSSRSRAVGLSDAPGEDPFAQGLRRADPARKTRLRPPQAGVIPVLAIVMSTTRRGGSVRSRASASQRLSLLHGSRCCTTMCRPVIVRRQDGDATPGGRPAYPQDDSSPCAPSRSAHQPPPRLSGMPSQRRTCPGSPASTPHILHPAITLLPPYRRVAKCYVQLPHARTRITMRHGASPMRRAGAMWTRRDATDNEPVVAM